MFFEVLAMKSTIPVLFMILALGGAWCVVSSQENTAVPVEVIRLTDENFDSVAPRGKEVDAIVGDLVLRNKHLVAVIAQPVATRNANMTVKTVAGALIDLTSREGQSDQLSAFYPGQRDYAYREWAGVGSEGAEIPGDQVTVLKDKSQASVIVRAAANNGKPPVETRYTLKAGDSDLIVETIYRNEGKEPIQVALTDDLRCDGGKEDMLKTPNGTVSRFTIEDRFWHQSYSFTATSRKLLTNSDARRTEFKYVNDSGQHVEELKPGESMDLQRRLSAAPTLPEILFRGGTRVTLAIQSSQGAKIHSPRVAIRRGNSVDATIIGNERGEIQTVLAPGQDYSLLVTVNGAVVAENIPVHIPPGTTEHSESIRLANYEPGMLVAKITDAQGRPIPCKIILDTAEGATPLNFGPESAEFGVKNLRYTPNGEFQQQLAPGQYKATVMHGPEYDAAFSDLVIESGKTARLEAKLTRVVDTKGWVSSDFHSHSTPSGDNTSSQLGRVLNLVSEHVEFAPCTEHNRISTYDAHIETLKIRPFVATCTGMELTGSPLPLNHQNVFPLHHHPHRQDGGGPVTDESPEVQIERIALWDNRSEKLIQQNHPDLGWLFYDRNGDGKPDEGYAKGFAFMDVMEVHPIHEILTMKATTINQDKVYNNTVFNWLQLLNQGHKIYGVVNTDAHYNFHGSGGFRNWIQSSTDDPAKIDTMEMVHASEQGRLVMSNGPFLEVHASETGRSARVTSGQSFNAPSKSVDLWIKVQCPNWFDIDRVFVLANGKILSDHDYTREKHPDQFEKGTVKFDKMLRLNVDQDAHLIVVAAGEKSTLGPVAGPDYGKQPPTALSNPIFVDVAGDGFTPNKDTLGFPLPVKEGGPVKK